MSYTANNKYHYIIHYKECPSVSKHLAMKATGSALFDSVFAHTTVNKGCARGGVVLLRFPLVAARDDAAKALLGGWFAMAT